MDRSNVMAEKAISYPFKFNEIGGVEYTSNQEQIWKDRIGILCLTRIEERVMLPNFGTRVPDSVFESEDDAIEMCRTSIIEAFAKWMPDLVFVDVRGTLDVDTSELSLEIYYTDPSGQPNSVNVRTAVLTRFGEIISEVVSG
jgi:phage baseplate assembly protein W